MSETAFRSVDDQIANSQDYGNWQVVIRDVVAGTSAANTTSGKTSMQRFPTPLTLPTMTSPVTGAYCTRLDMVTAQQTGVLIAGYETTLGSINMNTGTFTGGSAMPTRPLMGGSVTPVAPLVFAVVTAVITATTPTITITYTDQGGTTGQTATLVLPTNPAVNTCFFVNPHLASGDTGIREITNITKSAGTAGTLTLFGVHTIRVAAQGASVIPYNALQPGMNGIVPIIATGGERVAFYRTLSSSGEILAILNFVPDV